jgi:hypothetical protein
MIGNRAAVSAAIKGSQGIFTGRCERRSLVGEKLTPDIAKSYEIGGIGGRDRDKLTLAFAQIY